MLEGHLYCRAAVHVPDLCADSDTEGAGGLGHQICRVLAGTREEEAACYQGGHWLLPGGHQGGSRGLGAAELASGYPQEGD